MKKSLIYPVLVFPHVLSGPQLHVPELFFFPEEGAACQKWEWKVLWLSLGAQITCPEIKSEEHVFL